MRRVWLIKAGQDATEIDAMRRAGLIGLRYAAIGDARRLTAAEIEQRLIDDGQAAGVAVLRSTLLLFATDVRPGDLVVSPNAPRREVWVGAVSGDYEFDETPAITGYGHTRRVEWKGWLDRDAPWMRDQLKSLDRPPAMYELPGREWWWHQVDSREFAVQPRATWSKPPVKRTRTKSTTAATTTSTRKPPPVMVRCAGTCGFQWAPTSLVGGLCADCRND